MSKEVEREINNYLMRVASYLGSEEMIDEITMELRTHIEDRAQELAGMSEVRVEDVWRAIHELGEPREIAQGYLQPDKPSKIFISDELYPYFLRAIGVLSVVIVLIGLVGWMIRGYRAEDLSRTIFEIELAIPAVIGIMFVVFVYLSREGYTIETLRWKIETFFDARKVNLQGLGEEFRTRQEKKREEKRLRQAWKQQREEEHRSERERQREEARWQKAAERQRKWDHSIRPGQLGELFGAFLAIAVTLFFLSPYVNEIVGFRLNPDSNVVFILKQTFVDELTYVVVFLLIVAAMIHFATFVMGKTRSLYVARVSSALLELGFFVFLITELTYYFYEINLPGGDDFVTILATYDAIALFFGLLIIIKLWQVFWNTYKAASYPRVLAT